MAKKLSIFWWRMSQLIKNGWPGPSTYLSRPLKYPPWRACKFGTWNCPRGLKISSAWDTQYLTRRTSSLTLQNTAASTKSFLSQRLRQRWSLISETSNTQMATWRRPVFEISGLGREEFSAKVGPDRPERIFGPSRPGPGEFWDRVGPARENFELKSARPGPRIFF